MIDIIYVWMLSCLQRPRKTVNYRNRWACLLLLLGGLGWLGRKGRCFVRTDSGDVWLPDGLLRSRIPLKGLAVLKSGSDPSVNYSCRQDTHKPFQSHENSPSVFRMKICRATLSVSICRDCAIVLFAKQIHTMHYLHSYGIVCDIKQTKFLIGCCGNA